MNRKKSSAQCLARSGVPIREVLSVFLSAVICCSLTATASGPPEKEEPYRINLRSQVFTPKPGINPLLSEALAVRLEQGQTSRVFVQLYVTLDGCERADLEAQGVKLLAYLGSNTWYASLSQMSAAYFGDPVVAAASPALACVRWMGSILPEDKMAPAVADGQIGEWARTTNGKVELIVRYFGDAHVEQVREVLTAHGATTVGEMRIVNSIFISIDEDKIADLAAEDVICWIEPVPPPGRRETDRIRTHVQVDQVPAGLTGNGVTVGVFEEAHAGNHPDLTGRLTKGDADPSDFNWHPTMVAGVIGGNGSQSSNAGGTANQWRGMATQADIYTYDFQVGANPTPAQQHANYTGDLQTAISTHGIDIANNSWGSTGGCNEFEYGKYEGLCPTLDAAVHGDYGQPTTVVFSAGNERHGYDYDAATESYTTDCLVEAIAPFRNYWTLNHPKSAKNIIAVGAIDSANDRMSAYSSWGPTMDGRIKPEIVASGHHNGTLSSGVTAHTIQAHMYLAPYYPPSSTAYYGFFGMTSAAAPAVSGSAALLLQEYRDALQTQVDPLPSTVKALLIHSAEDLVDNNTTWYNPGPDFASGYGLLQINDAIDLIGTERCIEGKVNTGETDHYTLKVPAGATSIKVTLVWDDPPAASGATSALVNDLDLIVRDPGNYRHHPWTLNPNMPSDPAVQTAEDHINNVEQVVATFTSSAGPTDWTVVVEADTVSTPQRYSLVASDKLLGKIDIVHVLDRSGSMGDKASATMQDTKIKVLRDAAKQFVDMMVGNQLGLVQFNQNVVPFPAGSADALSSVVTTADRTAKKDTIDKIVHGGRTSIGDGLRKALIELKGTSAVAQHDRRILVVSDGKENEPEDIAQVQPDLINDGVTVYCLGLGYGSGIDEGKLTQLAQATGGTYRISAEELVFKKLFVEALANASNWSVSTDPIGELTADQTVRMPIPVAPDENSATITAYWEGIDDAIRLELITPSGRIISPDTSNRWIRYGQHPRYAFYQLDFPLGGDLAREWAGQWQASLAGTDKIDRPQQVRYSASALVEGGVELIVTFDRLYHLTGDTVQMRAQLIRSGRSLPGARLDVYGDVPLVAVGNVLREYRVDPNDLRQFRPDANDTTSMVDRTLRYLDELFGEPVLRRGPVRFQLYDDGRHRDGKADDGLYANSFTQTQTPGSYTFRFVASDIPAGGGHTTTREWTMSFYNAVRVERDYSDVVVRQSAVTADGIRYQVDIVPKDRFGNYLGPEHDVEVVIAYRGKERAVSLADLTDGSYSDEILVTHTERAAGATLNVSVDQMLVRSLTLIDPSLVAHWALDEEKGEIAYDMTGSHDAFLHGDPVWQPGTRWLGGALQLDGIDDYVKTEGTVLNPADGPFSVFAWIRGGRPGQVLLSQIPAGDPGVDWIATDFSDGALMTELMGPFGRPLVSHTVVTDETSHHIGFTWDSSMRKLYVDGVLAAQDKQTRLIDSFGHLNIGCGKDLAHGTFWTGLIYDVRIYDQALSAEEIEELAR